MLLNIAFAVEVTCSELVQSVVSRRVQVDSITGARHMTMT
jgi:hypothetical protein